MPGEGHPHRLQRLAGAESRVGHLDSALDAAGTNAHALGLDELGQSGILNEGARNPRRRAAAFAAAGAALTFFGFMHGEAIGIARSPVVAVSYLGVAGFLLGCAKFAGASPFSVPESTHEHAPLPEPAE